MDPAYKDQGLVFLEGMDEEDFGRYKDMLKNSSDNGFDVAFCVHPSWSQFFNYHCYDEESFLKQVCAYMDYAREIPFESLDDDAYNCFFTYYKIFEYFREKEILNYLRDKDILTFVLLPGNISNKSFPEEFVNYIKDITGCADNFVFLESEDYKNGYIKNPLKLSYFSDILTPKNGNLSTLLFGGHAGSCLSHTNDYFKIFTGHDYPKNLTIIPDYVSINPRYISFDKKRNFELIKDILGFFDSFNPDKIRIDSLPDLNEAVLSNIRQSISMSVLPNMSVRRNFISPVA